MYSASSLPGICTHSQHEETLLSDCIKSCWLYWHSCQMISNANFQVLKDRSRWRWRLIVSCHTFSATFLLFSAINSLKWKHRSSQEHQDIYYWGKEPRKCSYFQNIKLDGNCQRHLNDQVQRLHKQVVSREGVSPYKTLVICEDVKGQGYLPHYSYNSFHSPIPANKMY